MGIKEKKNKDMIDLIDTKLRSSISTVCNVILFELKKQCRTYSELNDRIFEITKSICYKDDLLGRLIRRELKVIVDKEIGDISLHKISLIWLDPIGFNDSTLYTISKKDNWVLVRIGLQKKRTY